MFSYLKISDLLDDFVRATIEPDRLKAADFQRARRAGREVIRMAGGLGVGGLESWGLGLADKARPKDHLRHAPGVNAAGPIRLEEVLARPGTSAD